MFFYYIYIYIYILESFNIWRPLHMIVYIYIYTHIEEENESLINGTVSWQKNDKIIPGSNL